MKRKHDKRKESLPGWRDEAGSSLVATILAIGMMATFSAAFLTRASLHSQVMKNIRATRSDEEVLDALESFIARQVRAYAGATQCTKGETFSLYINQEPLGSYARMKYLGVAPAVSANAPQEQKEAAQRCASPHIPDLNKYPYATAYDDRTYIHFCMSAQRLSDEALSSDSFLNSNNVFIEVMGQFFSPNWSVGQQCDGWNSWHRMNTRFLYSIYWGKNIDGRQVFKSHHGGFYGT